MPHEGTSEPLGLKEAEEQATEYLEPHLHLPTDVLVGAHQLLGLAVEAINLRYGGRPPLSARVVIRLAARVGNDLSGIRILTGYGYSSQAMSVGASVCELAFSISYIGSDDNRAQGWLDHGDPTRPFRSVTDLIKEATLQLPVEARTEAFNSAYRVYRQFCMAKHANPLLERHRGLRLGVSGEGIVENGPDLSEGSIQNAWFALSQSASFAWHAGHSVAITHFTAPQQQVFSDRVLSRVRVGLETLQGEAKKRGWDEDPLPGKWRLRTS